MALSIADGFYFPLQVEKYIQGWCIKMFKMHFMGWLIDLAKRCPYNFENSTPLLQQQSPLLADFDTFSQQFEAMYMDPVRTQAANSLIREMNQRNWSVGKYASEFQLLAQDLAWNQAALVNQFQEGLSDPILDELAHTECPEDL